MFQLLIPNWWCCPLFVSTTQATFRLSPCLNWYFLENLWPARSEVNFRWLNGFFVHFIHQTQSYDSKYFVPELDLDIYECTCICCFILEFHTSFHQKGMMYYSIHRADYSIKFLYGFMACTVLGHVGLSSTPLSPMIISSPRSSRVSLDVHVKQLPTRIFKWFFCFLKRAFLIFKNFSFTLATTYLWEPL